MPRSGREGDELKGEGGGKKVVEDCEVERGGEMFWDIANAEDRFLGGSHGDGGFANRLRGGANGGGWIDGGGRGEAFVVGFGRE